MTTTTRTGKIPTKIHALDTNSFPASIKIENKNETKFKSGKNRCKGMLEK